MVGAVSGCVGKSTPLSLSLPASISGTRDPDDLAAGASASLSGGASHASFSGVIGFGYSGSNGSGGAWLLNGSADNYECRAHVTSGSLASGTVDSWLPLTSSRTWAVSGTSQTCTFTLEIGKVGTSTALVSTTVSLT